MMNKELFLRAPLALLLVLAVAGCGVKSAPKPPEGSTYPRTYPAPPPETTETRSRPKSGAAGERTDTGYSRTDSSGYYNPPPPATAVIGK